MNMRILSSRVKVKCVCVKMLVIHIMGKRSNFTWILISTTFFRFEFELDVSFTILTPRWRNKQLRDKYKMKISNFTQLASNINFS
jgi:hypothetical protein